MLTGLTGAQGTGKTTLGLAYCEKHKKTTFHPTRVSQVFKQCGLDPAAVLGIDDRLHVQEQILKVHSDIYAALSIQGHDSIVDRTPIDFIGYAFAQIDQSSVSDSQYGRLAAYIDDCFATLNKYFSAVVVVPPGIPVAPDREGKGVSNLAYIEKVNMLMTGAMFDERNKTSRFVLDRDNLTVKGRVKSLRQIIKEDATDLEGDLLDYVASGKLVH